MQKKIIIRSKKNLQELVSTANSVSGKYHPIIRSRHPSHKGLRKALKLLPFRSVIRFGSTIEMDDAATLNGTRIELNPIEAIKNSSSKVRMKNCFKAAGVNTADFIISGSRQEIKEFAEKVGFPIVKKANFGSRGHGNTLLKTSAELDAALLNCTLTGFVFEKYCNYNKEYRLHVTADGCFYSCRKMLKTEHKDSPKAWQRHDDNCTWFLPENPGFDTPSNWDKVIEHCVKALVSCGLDFGACDLRIQNNLNENGSRREDPEFIVVEINSAPSFGDVTLEKYKAMLPNLLLKKKALKR